MNPFNLNENELTAEWASLRNGLKSKELSEQLTDTARWWAQCPFTNWTCDPNDPSTWITPWEMFHEGVYCKTAIAIGMFLTLEYGGISTERLRLTMTRNKQDGERVLVVIVDDEYVLNYDHAEVTKLEEIEDCLVGLKQIVKNNNYFEIRDMVK